MGGPKFRAIQGFSMGGFGAAKFLTKFPDLFNAAIVYDGALLNWTILNLSQALIASTIFANNEAYFNEFSPWFQAEKNKLKLQSRLRLRIVVGALVTWNRNFLNYLNELGILVEYVETTCLHDLNCLLNYEGSSSAAFLAECFYQAFKNQRGSQDKIKLLTATPPVFQSFIKKIKGEGKGRPEQGSHPIRPLKLKDENYEIAWPSNLNQAAEKEKSQGGESLPPRPPVHP